MILIFPFITKAQISNEDVLYLKNGDIIRGTVKRQYNNQELKIKQSDGSITTYNADSIAKRTITIDDSTYNIPIIDSNLSHQSGIKGTLDFNYGKGIGKYRDDASIGAAFIIDYQFDKIYYIGAGMGIDVYSQVTFVPIFVDLRMNLSNSTKVTTFCAVEAGYSLGSGYNKGGIVFNPSIGVKYYLSHTSSINLSLGFKAQENEIYYGDLIYIPNEIQYGNFINLKLGLTF
ncbi:MAG: hypothetical protein WCL51_08935 [Bacteroidota bacterium]